jgi:pyruvate kinase
MPKTKIICTLGPASSNATVLLKMMRAGMDVVRLNFSHGTKDEHLARIQVIRQLNKKYRRHVRIMGDLEGFRIRIGRFKDGKPVEVNKRQTIWFTAANVLSEGNVIPFDYTGPMSDIKKGQPLYIDDGNIGLVVEGVERDMLKAVVVVPGVIKEHKGVNLPDTRLTFKGVTDKDKDNLTFCLEQELDFVAQSFVRNRADILLLKEYIKESRFQPKIIAKIENRDGVRNVDAIMKECDGIMIARGDMGVSLPVYEVPMIQKSIIKKCNAAHKFVITATQMLESMVDQPLPTRAEVSDVANAILDGTNYVMLSAETSVGSFPAGCVDMMNKVIKFTEAGIKK